LVKLLLPSGGENTISLRAQNENLMRSDFSDFLIAASLFAGLVGCLELWFLAGRRVRRRRGEPLDQLANIQGATLGLLALLLGFSFALAAGRFSDRVQLIVQEANAIGTAWLRCDVLPTEQETQVRELLRRYVAERIKFYDATAEDTKLAAIAESEVLQERMWTLVSGAAQASPALANVLLPPFNELFDLHSSRIAASRRHMPAMLLALLLACSAVSVAAVGYGCGVAGKRNAVLTTALSFLIAGTLWAIIDMDHPRKGLIRVGQGPMLDLQRRVEQPPSANH
jgi:hypothetical protein